jgi:curved DNA-binding protein CbpA
LLTAGVMIDTSNQDGPCRHLEISSTGEESWQMADYYTILGVERDADLDAIRSAFRRLARRYHPDVSKGKHGPRRFLVIREAYQVLSDPEKRLEYDRLISTPIVISRPSAKRPTAGGHRTAASIESSVPARGFRLVLDALGILRLDLGVGFGAPSRGTRSRSRPSPASGPKRERK